MKIDTAIVAMELFKKIGLVQILENGEIYLTQLENMVGSETSKAAVMRKKRKKEKEELKCISNDNGLVIDESNNKSSGNNVTKVLPKCYTEIEKDKEQDTDINKETDKDTKKRKKSKNKNKSSCSSLNKSKNNVIENDDSVIYKVLGDDVLEGGSLTNINVYKHFEKCGFIVTSQLMEFISEDIKTYGEDWVIKAADECVRRGKANNYGYLTGILQNWNKNGSSEVIAEGIKANSSAYEPMKSVLDE